MSCNLVAKSCDITLIIDAHQPVHGRGGVCWCPFPVAEKSGIQIEVWTNAQLLGGIFHCHFYLSQLLDDTTIQVGRIHFRFRLRIWVPLMPSMTQIDKAA